MKKAMLTSLLLLAVGSTASFAQGKKTYDDDVYYNSKTAKTEAQKEETQPAESRAGSDDERTYSSSDRNSEQRNTQYADEYSDNDDDYYYSSRINRFNYPFYNRPYWSSFYNPYWYDPYWVDPYWGYNPWTRPGFSVSIGVGPYWSSYYGWSSWYGYGSFGSYYGYPAWGCGLGGYYSGYWNSYYAGLYNRGYGYRTVTYGPRYSLNANTNHFAGQVGTHGFRREVRTERRMGAEPGMGTTNPSRSGWMRGEGDRPARTAPDGATGNSGVSPEGRPSRSFFGNDDRQPSRGTAPQGEAAQTQPQRSRGGWFGGGRSEAPARSEGPRYTPSPRSEAPARSFGGGFGGSRSSGGEGRSSGGGGGSFGGRRGR